MSNEVIELAQARLLKARRDLALKSSPAQKADAAPINFFEEFLPEGIQPASKEEMREKAQREEERYQTEARERARLQRMSNLEASGVRLRREDYPAIATGRYDTTKAVDIVRRWWDRSAEGSVAVLLGDTGRGKTFAAATLVAEHGGAGVRSKALAALAGSKWSEHVAEFERLLKHPGLLVVDDVGAARDVDAEREMLFELVDERQGVSGRTVLTSNLPLRRPKDATREQVPWVIEERICERTLSRLHGVGAFFGCKGEDLRRRK